MRGEWWGGVDEGGPSWGVGAILSARCDSSRCSGSGMGLLSHGMSPNATLPSINTSSQTKALVRCSSQFSAFRQAKFRAESNSWNNQHMTH